MTKIDYFSFCPSNKFFTPLGLKTYIKKEHCIKVNSKLHKRDLRGLTNFIPYRRDLLLPTVIFLYEIHVTINQAAVISNFVEININKEDSPDLFDTLQKDGFLR